MQVSLPQFQFFLIFHHTLSLYLPFVSCLYSPSDFSIFFFPRCFYFVLVYSASKAFVNAFSQALYYEYKDQGIHVQTQLPAFVVRHLFQYEYLHLSISIVRSLYSFLCLPFAYTTFTLLYILKYSPFDDLCVSSFVLLLHAVTLQTTKMSKLRNTSFFVCSPRSYAKALCAHIGYGAFVLTWWTHALQIAYVYIHLFLYLYLSFLIT